MEYLAARFVQPHTLDNLRTTMINIWQDLKAQGRQQNLEGQQQEAKGQLSDLGSGMANRAQGMVGRAISGVTSDTTGKDHYEQMRAEGKTQQRGAEHDIQKQADASNKS